MELSDYVGSLRKDLASITRFAGDDIARAAEMLAESLESSVRLTLLDVLSAAAEEITTGLQDTVIDVRLSSGEPEFVVTSTAVQEPDEHEPAEQELAAVSDDAGTARVTLRLAESLKARVEAEAAAAGLSVNTWLVHAAIRALSTGESGPPPRQPRPPRPLRLGVGQRITGYARG
jgi:hypothetical protein